LGDIKSKVLSEKKGVITEERFQKMTPAQWQFHYLEIIKNRKEKFDYFIKPILNHLELTGTMANPQAGKKLREIREMDDAKADLSEENFAEHFEDLKSKIPNKLVVNIPEEDQRNKYILPVYKREEKEFGIKFDDEEESGE